jgi:hypothetical protein
LFRGPGVTGCSGRLRECVRKLLRLIDQNIKKKEKQTVKKSEQSSFDAKTCIYTTFILLSSYLDKEKKDTQALLYARVPIKSAIS